MHEVWDINGDEKPLHMTEQQECAHKN